MTVRAATATGAVAVLLWSALAALSVGTAPVPPFLLNALTFGLGALVGFAWMAASGRRFDPRSLRTGLWLLGVGGLFGYHALYFTALRLAPAAEASLIAYLWPLLIVIFAGFLPGERLSLWHLAGAVLSFAGAAVLVGGTLGGGHLAGHAAALACAVTWAGYSVLSRRFGTAQTEAVAWFCAATALLSVPAHLAFETTAWPAGGWGWAAVAALGAGPVGLAFYAWDIGVKRGDIRLLAVISYAAPLVSTGLLVVTGLAPAQPGMAVAALLIVAGAAVAARASARVPDRAAVSATASGAERSLP